MKTSRRILFISVAVFSAALVALWYFTRLNPAQQALAHTLQVVDAIAVPGVGGGRTFSATLKVLRATGLLRPHATRARARALRREGARR